MLLYSCYCIHATVFMLLYSCYCIHATVFKLLHSRYCIHDTASGYCLQHRYIVIMMLAFLYQVTSGLSPFFVLVSAMSALPAIKSSCVYVRANLPVMAEYMGSMTSKSVGKSMSK